MKNASKVLKQAQTEAVSAPSWADLSNVLFDPVYGLVTRAFPKRKEREEFFKTPEYAAIRELINNSIHTHGLVEGATPKKKSGRFVVRLPQSLHEALELEAQREGVSLNQLVVAKLAVQLNSMAGDPMASIIQAFLEVRQGYSTDRVIADPEMDRIFLRRCRELGLSGTDFELNWKLFNARKNGYLSNIPKTKEYTISSEKRDEFEYASEIAARFLQQKYDPRSLDKILCDPDIALEFDEAALRLAPGFSPLEYRWVALALRKAHRLTPEMRNVQYPEFSLLGSTRSVDLSQIPGNEGIYLFRSEQEAVFVGETNHLRHRIENHLNSSGLNGLPAWLYRGHDIQIGIQSLPDVSQTARKAMELKAIQKYHPLFNILVQDAA
jgi:site-specific DNA-methyltransferase (adenine-specific)